MRVASLVPAATEILRFLGVEPVGVSHCCAVTDKPVLTESILPKGLSQAEIDRRVRQAVQAGQSLYRVRTEVLEALKPDLILTQGVCEVCAVGPGELRQAVDCLSFGVPTLSLQGTRLAHLWDDLRAVAAATGVSVEAGIEELQGRLERVRRAVAGRKRPRVAFIEWLEPPFLGGHWVPDLLEAAGGEPVGARPEAPSFRTTWEEIAAWQPEVLLFSFCGYGLEAALRDLTGWKSPLSGVECWALDSAYFCALTPQVVRGVEILAGILHPEAWPLPSPEEALRR
ncbi:ABC transporter substrate-binding protein [Meiothermus taiwanensis]|jgi:iron complex transport system substrate-binding protein|uniref:Vitamin B12-binding protein n=2 Tax=Meiothermus taiwanensis TaxID=172827 RepID=A0A399E7N0_9DEIN|nr:ABC transporter substrate-binding protein [Meiothermus taiwanensis]AWR87839.1 putative periplasmic substrate-binding protein [Meiothermus taiwanensis WR-220]KIQ53772.1 ABC transporter substrate-binding protein [Meiothermus taiwanensis]KZK15438.1 ABC transporter substrate-binding protein [Meiothermus taiwanensis]RIH79876.1 Vitamin B12-binding protein [Meiothermus taiwanensis]